jgi:aminodeoxyfutalosine deaminase
MAEDMRMAAADLIGRLGERRIALEVCPTSNLRITQVQSWREHPLFSLAPLDDSLRRLDVTLCTDNPGLCQTTIALEAAAARQILVEQGATALQALEWLERLRADSNRVAFSVPV